VAPEAAVGGPLALVEEGDTVTIDGDARRVDLEVAEGEVARRRAAWTPPPARARRGVLAKYARLVGSASEGAVTDRPAAE
jgi:dihydroxy-acid dehydratase